MFQKYGLVVLMVWGLAGWIVAGYLFFCSPLPDSENVSDKQSFDFLQFEGRADATERDSEFEFSSMSGAVWVVDSVGQPVGVLISRSHPTFSNSEIYDTAMVYDPQRRIFYTVLMTTGEVLRPAKVMFSKGNCTGNVGVRTTCSYCRSGFDLAFEINGTWYLIQGGVGRKQFQYSSYIPPEPDGVCTGHGSSTTYVFPAVQLPPDRVPPKFTPPYHFVWAEK